LKFKSLTQLHNTSRNLNGAPRKTTIKYWYANILQAKAGFNRLTACFAFTTGIKEC